MSRLGQKERHVTRDWKLCLKYVTAVVSLGAAILASIILPSKVLAWQDEQRLGESQIEQVTEVELAAQMNMSITEKINLLNSSQGSTIGMQNGRYYTQDTIWQKVKEELLELRELGILEDEDLDHFVLENREVIFVMNRQDSEQSMMFWSGSGQTDQSYIEWVLDDETGQLLGIHQWSRVDVSVGKEADTKGWKKDGDAEAAIAEASSVETTSAEMPSETSSAEAELAEISEKWAHYLGCELADAPDEIKEVTAYDTQAIYSEEAMIELESLVKSMVEEGMEEAEAYLKAMMMLGYVVELGDGTYAILEDEQGIAAFRVQKNAGDGFLSIHFGF